MYLNGRFAGKKNKPDDSRGYNKMYDLPSVGKQHTKHILITCELPTADDLDSYLYNVIQIKTLSVRKSHALWGLSPIWHSRTGMTVALVHRNLPILIL